MPSTKKSKKSPVVTFNDISYFWSEPDRPPHPAPLSWKEGEPFLTDKVLNVPQEGESISVVLPSYQTVFIPPPIVTAHGRVVSVERTADAAYRLTIERHARVGFDWNTLCHFIGARSIGYHDTFGRIEGELRGLLPAAEVAGLAVPELKPIIDDMMKRAVEAGDFDEDILEDNDDDPVIYVAWSTLWPGETLRLNPLERDKRQSKQKK